MTPLPDDFASHFELVADLAPDRLAVARGEESLTWGAFEDSAARLAGWLAGQGIGDGDRVAMMARNSPDYLVALFAIWKLRATMVNVNYRYRAEEAAYVLADANATAVIADDDLLDVARAPIVLRLGDGTDGAPLPRTEREGDREWLLYTGGTTGRPDRHPARPRAGPGRRRRRPARRARRRPARRGRDRLAARAAADARHRAVLGARVAGRGRARRAAARPRHLGRRPGVDDRPARRHRPDDRRRRVRTATARRPRRRRGGGPPVAHRDPEEDPQHRRRLEPGRQTPPARACRPVVARLHRRLRGRALRRLGRHPRHPRRPARRLRARPERPAARRGRQRRRPRLGRRGAAGGPRRRRRRVRRRPREDRGRLPRPRRGAAVDPGRHGASRRRRPPRTAGARQLGHQHRRREGVRRRGRDRAARAPGGT